MVNTPACRAGDLGSIPCEAVDIRLIEGTIFERAVMEVKISLTVPQS